MLYRHDGKQPNIHATSRIAPNAVVCGDVTIGPNCSIGFGAVLTAESGPIAIGANCIIMDTAVIRGVRGNPVRIGDNVLVGPRAYLTGCEVADDAFLATSTHRPQLWPLRPGDLVDAACKQVPRNLSDQEWHRYIGAEPYRPTCSGLPSPVPQSANG